LQLVAQGAVHLTAIKLLGPHLRPDNHEQLLECARGKGKREVEQLVAGLAPKPDVPTRIRKLRQQGSAPSISTAVKSSPTSAGAQQAPFAQPASVTSSSVDASITSSTEAASVEAKQAGFPLQAFVGPCAVVSDTQNATPVRDRDRAQFVLEAPRQRGSCTPLSPGR
jgi:hypothetical protein